MEKYIVDASVILKWVLEKETEPGHDKATRLLLAWMNGDVGIAVAESLDL